MTGVRQRRNFDGQNASTSKTIDGRIKTKKSIPMWQAVIGNVWFFTLSAIVCYLTDTYHAFMIAFGIHFMVFGFHAMPMQSEKYYDFTGMISFLCVNMFSYFGNQHSVQHLRNTLLSLFVTFWASRLGMFLFLRILQHGGIDTRFNTFKGKFWHFLMVWTMSAQWVYFCALPVVIVNRKPYVATVYVTDFIGWTLFALGCCIEIIADVQKTKFKSNAKNAGKFIRQGVWAYSRHPNYFGNILLWTGIAISAYSVATNVYDLFVFVSPLWSAILLIFMSGIPPSEATFRRKYKNVEGFQEYLDNTPILVPFCCC